MIPYLEKYSGQQMLNGAQAEPYGDHFIAVHLSEMPYHGVYAKISSAALRTQPPPSAAGAEVVVEIGTTDAEGNLEPPAVGEVVLSVPSPEALAREAVEVRRVIAHAGTGVEPLVLVLEAAEELREDELSGVLEAAGHTSRSVILRIIRGA